MKFSVIIPLYNKAPYVAKAIQSVLSQTINDYELIVVDDGSSDDSAEIAAQAIKGYGNCRLIRQENAGVSIARNNGVAASNGECLCFLDADDWWEPTFLEEMSKLMADFPDAGIYGTNYTIVDETKHKTRVSPVGVDENFEKGYINYCQVYAKTLAMPIWTGAVCLPRQVFVAMKGFPKGIKLGEDFLLWIHIALQYKVAFLNKPLAYYNQDASPNFRSIGKLYPPENHMVWNLTDLESIERTDQDYKQLIDNVRTYALLPYYLSKEYHKAAKLELAKVDWDQQPAKVRKRYEKPVVCLRLECWLTRLGVKLKQKLRYLKK